MFVIPIRLKARKQHRDHDSATGGCSEGPRCVQIFLKTVKTYINRTMADNGTVRDNLTWGLNIK